MQQEADVVQDLDGNAVAGAAVQVLVKATGELAKLFADDETTQIANPVYTDANGRYAWKAANGKYKSEVMIGGRVFVGKADITLYDADDDPPLTLAQASGVTGAERIGHGAESVAAALERVKEQPRIADRTMGSIAARMAAGATVKLACYGDSTTDGNETNGWTANPTINGGQARGTTAHVPPNAWPIKLQTILRDMFSNQNITVWNAGYSGQRMDNGWALANYDTAITNNPAYGKPDLCFIGFGLNDILATNAYIAHAGQTRLLVEKLLRTGITPVLLTCDAIYRNEEAVRGNKESSRQIDQVKRAIAHEFGIPMIDMGVEIKKWFSKNRDGYRWPAEQTDGIHLQDNGHAFKASIIARELFRDTVMIGDAWSRLTTFDSRAALLGSYTKIYRSSFTDQGGNIALTSDDPILSTQVTAWVWNESPDTELIYRGIAQENYSFPSSGVLPTIKVTEQIKKVTIAKSPSAVGFPAENTTSRKSDLPYRFGHLAYGLNKVEYVLGDDSSVFFGNFEFWQTTKGVKRHNALKQTGYFQKSFSANGSQLDLIPEYRDGSNVYGLMMGEAVEILVDVTLPPGTSFVFAHSQCWDVGATYGDKVFSHIFRHADNALRIYTSTAIGTSVTLGNSFGFSSVLSWAANREKFRITITRIGDDQVVNIYNGYASNTPIFTLTRSIASGLPIAHVAGAVGGLYANGSISGAVTAAIHELVVSIS